MELSHRMVATEPRAKCYFLSAYGAKEFGSPPTVVEYLTKPIKLQELASVILS